jgi:hypothetical protein
VDERGFSLKYAKNKLKKWTPAAVVPEQAGQPGEMGKPVHLPADQESLMREKFRLNQFNLLASDSISLNRSLPDVRLEGYASHLNLYFFAIIEPLFDQYVSAVVTSLIPVSSQLPAS